MYLKGHHQEGEKTQIEKIIEKHIQDKDYIKKSYNSIIREKNNLKMGKGSEYISSKKIHIWPTCAWKDVQSLAISEMQIKTIMRYHFIPRTAIL